MYCNGTGTRVYIYKWNTNGVYVYVHVHVHVPCTESMDLLMIIWRTATSMSSFITTQFCVEEGMGRRGGEGNRRGRRGDGSGVELKVGGREGQEEVQRSGGVTEEEEGRGRK